MTPRQFKCAIICASAAAAAAPVDAATRDYTRIEIGLRDINNHNQGTGGGYFWQNEGSAPLGTLSGTGLSSGIAISDAGHVTGISTDYVNGWRGFLVTPEDTNVDGVPDRWHRDNDGNGINDLMIDLGARHPGGESDARDVNSFGQVVGSSANQAVVWNNGTLIDLGPATYFAYGINDHGQVVGGGHAGTFLINPEDSDANGSPDRWYRDADNDGANDLMTTLFGVGWGVEINEQGQILVQAQDYALLWTPDAPNGTSGSAVSLSPDPLLAIGINNAGQAIAGAPGNLMNAPVLWENGSISTSRSTRRSLTANWRSSTRSTMRAGSWPTTGIFWSLVCPNHRGWRCRWLRRNFSSGAGDVLCSGWSLLSKALREITPC